MVHLFCTEEPDLRVLHPAELQARVSRLAPGAFTPTKREGILSVPAMAIRDRRTLLFSLVGIFFVQTWLVYSDPAGRHAEPLSAEAARGRAIWHDRNCQSCHQIYGFGGFLGPDLTNLAERMGAEDGSPDAMDGRLETVLTTGSERMPAFHMDAADRRALASFFTELSATGVGQVVVREARAPRAIFAELVGSIEASAGALTPLEAGGRRVMEERGCIDCHLPNGKSTFRSTDLTRIHAGVDPVRVATVLDEGIPAKGMPRFALSPAEIEGVQAFLEVLGKNGPEVRLGFENAEMSSSGSLRDLPWFEYP